MTGISLARRVRGRILYLFCLAAILMSVIVLFAILADIFVRGIGTLNFEFLSNYPSRFPAKAGIKSALYGTLWVISLTALFCIPVSLAAAVYLEEYAKDNFFNRFIEINIVNLAGVPSIIYGILGLALFVRGLALGRSVVAGALTLALLVMPLIIVATREAIRTVPLFLSEASYALGATKWQTIRRIIIPSAFSGIITGNILALSRAIGETAPLIMIGALTFVAFVPSSPLSPFTALPIQIYNWVSRPQEGFHQIAASGIIVLLLILFLMNGLATYLRYKFHKKGGI